MNKLEQRRIRVEKIIPVLKKLYPISKTALNYSNPLQLLVATILSAQSTDKTVNIVTEKLFKKYKTLDDYVKADPKEFEVDIKSTGFYHNKAKNVLKSAKIIKEQYGGKVPDTMEDLMKLPGVARKTANIVIYLSYGKIEGVAVDTHVRRLTKVLGLTDHEDPNKIEKDLMQIIPKREWMDFTFRLVFYGREYCKARPHDHANCPLSKI